MHNDVDDISHLQYRKSAVPTEAEPNMVGTDLSVYRLHTVGNGFIFGKPTKAGSVDGIARNASVPSRSQPYQNGPSLQAKKKTKSAQQIHVGGKPAKWGKANNTATDRTTAGVTEANDAANKSMENDQIHPAKKHQTRG